jgi:hypothetical protein
MQSVRLKKFISILSAIYLLQGFYSCALREDESPVTSRSTFIPPTSPEIVVANLTFSIIEKDVNNYMQCFTDSNYSVRRYSYVPDVASGIQYPIFRFWTLTNEKNYFQGMLASTNNEATSNLFLSNQTVNTFSDTAFIDADYLLRVDHQRVDVPKTLKGKLRFILSSDTRNLWAIHRWIDIQTNNDTTWSVLKANFSN